MTLPHSVNSVYCIWLVFWAPTTFYVSITEWHKSSREINQFHITLCITLEQASIFILESGVSYMCWESWSTLSNVTQQCLTSFKWCFLISNRFLRVGWLGPRVNTYMVWLDIPTLFSVENGPSCTLTNVWDVSVSHNFAVEGISEVLKFGVHYLKFHLSLPSFPCRLRIYRLQYL